MNGTTALQAASAVAERMEANALAAIASLRRGPKPRSVLRRGLKRLFPPAALGVLLIFGSVVFLDAPSVAWAESLPPAFRAGGDYLTELGRSYWNLVPSGIAMLILLAGGWNRVSPMVRRFWSEIGALLLFLFLAVAGSGLAVDLVKEFIGRGRPVVFPTHGDLSFIPFQFTYANESFPSGHATTAGALAVVVFLIAPQFGWVAALLALAVGASRVVVGAHYPSDVIAGLMAGSGFTYLLGLTFASAGYGFSLTGRDSIRVRAAVLRRFASRPGGLRPAWAGLRRALAAETTGTDD